MTHIAGSCSAQPQPTPPDPFLPHSLPATLPQACSVAWGCGSHSAEPSTGLAELHPIGLSPAVRLSRSLCRTFLFPGRSTLPPNLQTYWGCTQCPYPGHQWWCWTGQAPALTPGDLCSWPVRYNWYITGFNPRALQHKADRLLQDQEELVDLLCTCFVTLWFSGHKKSFFSLVPSQKVISSDTHSFVRRHFCFSQNFLFRTIFSSFPTGTSAWFRALPALYCLVQQSFKVNLLCFSLDRKHGNFRAD